MSRASRDFSALLPRQSRSAFEFRHASWFDDEVFGLLREHQAALCIAEAEDDLEVPVVRTAHWGYLRLRRPDYDDTELKAWINTNSQAGVARSVRVLQARGRSQGAVNGQTVS